MSKEAQSMASIESRSHSHSILIAAATAFAAVILMLGPAGLAYAAKPAIERVINNHFTHSQHFDEAPECGPYGWAGTEIATGNERLVIVDRGDSVHVTYGETFKILAVPDDPSIPTNTRQGTDALSFNLIKDGTVVIFKESFHDFGPAAWDPFAKIQYFRTFVYRDGAVLVDREFGRDLPPEGC
jgi:hypothetical protein